MGNLHRNSVGILHSESIEILQQLQVSKLHPELVGVYENSQDQVRGTLPHDKIRLAAEVPSAHQRAVEGELSNIEKRGEVYFLPGYEKITIREPIHIKHLGIPMVYNKFTQQSYLLFSHWSGRMKTFPFLIKRTI